MLFLNFSLKNIFVIFFCPRTIFNGSKKHLKVRFWRKPCKLFFSAQQFLTNSELKLQILRSMSFLHFFLRNIFVINCFVLQPLEMGVERRLKVRFLEGTTTDWRVGKQHCFSEHFVFTENRPSVLVLYFTNVVWNIQIYN